MTTTIIIILLLSLYVLKSIVIGVHLSKSGGVKNGDEYFLAGRSLNWVFLGFTVFATWISTFAYLGSPGFYYSKGVQWLFTHGALVVLSPLLLWFIGRKIWAVGQAHKCLTPGDLLYILHKNKSVRIMSGIISLFALIPYSLIQLIGIGKVVSVATQGTISFGLGVVIAGIVIGFYAFYGGIRAIIWTDIFQSILFMGVMIVSAIVAVYYSGGFVDGLARSIQSDIDVFILNQSSFGSPITLALIWTFGFVTLPHMWQRIYMAKSVQTISKTVVFSCGLTFFFVLFPCLTTGIYSIGLIPYLADTDALLPTLLGRYFEIGLPFLVLGTFAAGMSTIDSQLLTSSSILVKDILEPIMERSFTPTQVSRIGRFWLVFLIFFLVLTALLPFSKGSIILIASKGVGIAFMLVVPLCFPLLLNRSSYWGSAISLFGGFGILIGLELTTLGTLIPYQFGPPVVAAICQIILYRMGMIRTDPAPTS
ncbi:sodium:solute symporter family protein [bacterium]|jgi:solute:Na+ symporter, SSS family|nr:sodium:solute symporter family protein [bacterium]